MVELQTEAMPARRAVRACKVYRASADIPVLQEPHRLSPVPRDRQEPKEAQAPPEQRGLHQPFLGPRGCPEASVQPDGQEDKVIK